MKVRNRKHKIRRGFKPRKPWAAYIRNRARHVKVGTIIETCGCDVARVVSVDPESDDLTYESLTRGGRGSCSIYNCGPQRLRPAAIEKRLALFKQGGMKALYLRYYVEDCKMTQEDAEKTIEQWNS